jgi:hypothetical protein
MISRIIVLGRSSQKIGSAGTPSANGRRDGERYRTTTEGSDYHRGELRLSGPFRKVSGSQAILGMSCERWNRMNFDDLVNDDPANFVKALR